MVHDYFSLLLCKWSIWFTEQHIFKIIIYFFNVCIRIYRQLCHLIWGIWWFIGQKILKLWRQKSWPFWLGWATNIAEYTHERNTLMNLPSSMQQVYLFYDFIFWLFKISFSARQGQNYLQFVFRAFCFGYFAYHRKGYLSETPFSTLLEPEWKKATFLNFSWMLRLCAATSSLLSVPVPKWTFCKMHFNLQRESIERE